YHASVQHEIGSGIVAEVGYIGSRGYNLPFYSDPNAVPVRFNAADGHWQVVPGDRKSTRLNSSHVSMSYAVFCLKKKIRPRDRLITRMPSEFTSSRKLSPTAFNACLLDAYWLAFAPARMPAVEFTNTI